MLKNIGSILSNAKTIASGTLISQIIIFGLSPILSRIFIPSDFGIYASISAIVSLLSSISTIKIDLAIISSDTNNEANYSFWAAFIINNIFVILSFLIILTLVIFLHIEFIFIIIPLLLLLSISLQLLQFTFNRYEHYFILSSSSVITEIFGILSSILYGILHIPHGLILGFATGRLIGFLYSLFFSIKLHTIFFEKKYLIMHKLIITLKTNMRYMFFTTPASLMNTASTQIVPLMLSSIYGYNVTGSYAMSQRIVRTPMILIGSALGQVVFQRLSMRKNEKIYIKDTIRSFVIFLSIFAILPTLLVMLYAKEIFAYIFGINWIEAGTFTSVLMPWAFMMFITSPVSSIAYVYNKQKEDLIFTALILFSRIISLSFGWIFNWPLLTSLLIFSLSGAFAYVIYLIFILKLSGNGFNNFFKKDLSN